MQSAPHDARLFELEQTLVSQFRTLQKLLDVTRSERNNLLKDQTSALLTDVEEKEAILDQLSLLEDKRRMLVQETAMLLDLHSDETSVKELLPYLEPNASVSIGHLAEGISSLVVQVRDYSLGNQALANSRLDWLKSFQSFLVDMALPDPGYRPPGSPKQYMEPAMLGMEYRA
jgi:flagellar biosynthesis/type III secretory pathway chaperone